MRPADAIKLIERSLAYLDEPGNEAVIAMVLDTCLHSGNALSVRDAMDERTRDLLGID